MGIADIMGKMETRRGGASGSEVLRRNWGIIFRSSAYCRMEQMWNLTGMRDVIFGLSAHCSNEIKVKSCGDAERHKLIICSTAVVTRRR